MRGKIPFCMYVHRASTFLIVPYDVFAYGTGYLISPTKSNNPGNVAFPPISADEQTLLKGDYED